MRRTAILYTIALLLFACGEEQPQYSLEGNTGKSNDTLYIYGVDSRYIKIDTVITDNEGAFRYSLPTDTIIPLNLIMSNGDILPVYAQPNTEAILNNAGEGWHITGGELQTLHDSIVSKIDSIGELSQKHEAIDNFIKQHPYSDVNIYLLWHYFADVNDSRSSIIRHRIELMGGTLQDNSFVASIKEAVSIKQQNIQHRSAPDFELQALDHSTLRRPDYKDKYLLLTFWASWDSASVKYMNQLKELATCADTTGFKMISISLDYDSAAWHRAIERDSFPGSHVCDGKMWESSIVKEFTIDKLPFSLLVNPYMRIDKFHITPEWIISNVDSLTESYKDKLRRKSSNLKSTNNKKIKSSKQVKPKEEPKKERDKARPRPGMKRADENQKAKAAPSKE